MTDKEIVKTAIHKATEGGFKWHTIWPALLAMGYTIQILDGDKEIAFYADGISPRPWTMSWEKLIFNHDFAKAVWGESGVPALPIGGRLIHPWEAHLQQMVIADNPIKYLGEHI